ncbi:hypothetical protein AgCh_004435 [Apium graveolens]
MGLVQEMTEKIERMKLDFESRDKQFMELQGLHNSQLQLTSELSDKLEKTEKKLHETEHALVDLEERHRQANATIKEKEYLISNLIKSERSLIERAFELRAELESAALDVSSLFTKIEHKDKIENGNRTLIQKFQAQLSQQLESLHKTVAASVTQQEQQLRGMEEDMQLFVSTKAEATEELRKNLMKLKNMYGSGIESLDGIAGELDENSKSIVGQLNNEVSKHSSALEEGAIVYSNIVTTVSPTYAQEVRTVEMASTLNMSNFANRDSLLWLESKPVDAMSRASGLDNHGVVEQDEGLEKLEETIISTKHIALTINEELNLHTRLIDNFDEHVNVTNSRLKRMLLQSPLIVLAETVVKEEGCFKKDTVDSEVSQFNVRARIPDYD